MYTFYLYLVYLYSAATIHREMNTKLLANTVFYIVVAKCNIFNGYNKLHSANKVNTVVSLAATNRLRMVQ